jgi:hypothetical protein
MVIWRRPSFPAHAAGRRDRRRCPVDVRPGFVSPAVILMTRPNHSGSCSAAISLGGPAWPGNGCSGRFPAGPGRQAFRLGREICLRPDGRPRRRRTDRCATRASDKRGRPDAGRAVQGAPRSGTIWPRRPGHPWHRQRHPRQPTVTVSRPTTSAEHAAGTSRLRRSPTLSR